eukprot:g13501.t1
MKVKSVEDRLSKMKSFHLRLRKLLKEPPIRRAAAGGSTENNSAAIVPVESPVYGRFSLNARFNVDHIGLAFVNGLGSTWDETGALRVQISQPFPGPEKRQCTVNCCIGAGDKIMRTTVIFRGKDKVSAVERAAYDPGVDVLFQENAWMDGPSCVAWAKNSFLRSLKGQEDGSLDDRITPKGVVGAYYFMDGDTSSDEEMPDQDDEVGDNDGGAGGGESSCDSDASADDEGDDHGDVQDPLSQLHSDDDVDSDDDIIAMKLPNGFCLQESPPAKLERALTKRCVFLRRTISVKMPLDAYNVDEANADVGAWALIEPIDDSEEPAGEGEGEQPRRQGSRARTLNVRNIDQPG